MAISLEQKASPRLTSIVSILALIAFLPLFLFATYQSVILITRALGVPAKIVVDTKIILEPINTDFYHAFAQGGEEVKDMIAPVISETKALRPAVIRIDHIYDYFNVVQKNGDSLSYDFSRLDQSVNSILATGAKPLLVLSFMPQAIAKDGVVINPPNNWNDWAQVVQRTIEHYSGKNEKNLSGVYYEVWNEPDLEQFGSWKMGGEKNYLTLYQYASIGASQAKNVNTFYLGGPSTTGLYKNWILGLAKSGYRIDFFSWHSYLSDPTRFADDQKNFISWLLPYPRYAVVPSLITEFGMTGNKSSLYGSTYAAAYTTAVIRQLISGGPKYLFSFEIIDGPNQGSSGWGLLSHTSAGKKPKPRYSVYSFIDTMAGSRLQVTGEGSWVTGFATTKEGVIRLLLVNFDRNGTHVEEVPVSFLHLDPGQYQYRERILFGRDITTTETVTEDGSLAKTIILNPQNIAIIEITKQ